ncbi:MAG: hypothetical protein ACRC2O_06465, partial [Chitinophagaceae bacterium]
MSLTVLLHCLPLIPAGILSLPEIYWTNMILSYKWLMDYLPIPVEPDKLSRILNSIGLEVEGFDDY